MTKFYVVGFDLKESPWIEGTAHIELDGALAELRELTEDNEGYILYELVPIKTATKSEIVIRDYQEK